MDAVNFYTDLWSKRRPPHLDKNPLFYQIIISDNGSGIDEQDLPHIFERFYKGKNSNDNSFGIGLAFARMVIRRQNGTIKAENIPTGGAKFTIKFYKTENFTK